MSLIAKIKKGFQRRSLEKLVEKKTVSEPMSFQKARMVGVIFDASDLEKRKVALNYIESLRKQGKQVRALGYFDMVQPETNFSFKFYTKKDMNWKGLPIKEEIKQFLENKFDLFINLCPTTNLYSEAIAALSKAVLKIGPVSDNFHCYDLMIDSSNTLSDFMAQLELLLQKTNNSHEPTQV